MLLVDVSQTAHVRAQTGIQRMSRGIATSMARARTAMPVTYDPYERVWRRLDPLEQKLARGDADALQVGGKRSARWTWRQRMRGWVTRFNPLVTRNLPARKEPWSAVIVPDVPNAQTVSAYPALLHAVEGPLIALFADASPLRAPQTASTASRAAFPAYLKTLAGFSGVAAISQASADELRGYWKWLGVQNPPPVEVVPLGVEAGFAESPSEELAAKSAKEWEEIENGWQAKNLPNLRLLVVATWEPRKNLLALARALELLPYRTRRKGIPLTFLFSGRRHLTNHSLKVHNELLIASDVPTDSMAATTDADIHAATHTCDAALCVSIDEGFGLPIEEALAAGKPCIVTPRGALLERAAQGGCLVLDDVTPEAIATGLTQFLEDSDLRQRLAEEARQRKVRTWNDIAIDLTAFAASLRGHRAPLRIERLR